MTTRCLHRTLITHDKNVVGFIFILTAHQKVKSVYFFWNLKLIVFISKKKMYNLITLLC